VYLVIYSVLGQLARSTLYGSKGPTNDRVRRC